MVIVPTMLTSVAGVDALIEHIEVLALGNLDPCIHFAILSDFADTDRAPMRPTTRRCSPRARDGDRRRSTPGSAGRRATASSCSTAIASGTIGEQAWIGWERKRGKIEEFNRLLRGAADTSFSTAVGDLERAAVDPLLHHARLRHAAAARRGQAPDRHHRASAEPAAVRPGAAARDRRLRHPAAARQRDDGECGGVALRQDLCRPHRRRPLHDRRIRRLPGSLRRRHLHRQGAVRRGCLLRRARGPRAGERAAVARPVRGAVRAHRAGDRHRGRRRLSVERAGARQAAAPLGPWRLADSRGGCFRSCRSRTGIAAQSPAAHLALEDPGQPAPQPDAAGDRAAARLRLGVAARAAGDSGPASAWRRSPCRWCSRSCAIAERPAARGSLARSSCGRATRTCQSALRASGCSSPFMANEAYERLHAIAVTLVRLGVTRRRLLEWETTAASAARAARCSCARSSPA